mmetsp:Transcript_248/g.754  ORF Transcript_248/g.754 Transcript_248/m.754 type:complete len:657 (-) Transcript_248:441-2411(-)
MARPLLDALLLVLLLDQLDLGQGDVGVDDLDGLGVERRRGVARPAAAQERRGDGEEDDGGRADRGADDDRGRAAALLRALLGRVAVVSDPGTVAVGGIGAVAVAISVPAVPVPAAMPSISVRAIPVRVVPVVSAMVAVRVVAVLVAVPAVAAVTVGARRVGAGPVEVEAAAGRVREIDGDDAPRLVHAARHKHVVGRDARVRGHGPDEVVARARIERLRRRPRAERERGFGVAVALRDEELRVREVRARVAVPPVTERRVGLGDAVRVDRGSPEALGLVGVRNSHDDGRAVHAVLLAPGVPEADRHPADAALDRVRDRYLGLVRGERPGELADGLGDKPVLPGAAFVDEVDDALARLGGGRGGRLVRVVADFLVRGRDARERRGLVRVGRALRVVVAVLEAVGGLAEDVRALEAHALGLADLLGDGLREVVREVHAAEPAEERVLLALVLGELARREVPRAAHARGGLVAVARRVAHLAEGHGAVERRDGVEGREDHDAVPAPVEAVDHLDAVGRRAEARGAAKVLVHAVAEHDEDRRRVVGRLERDGRDGAVAELDAKRRGRQVLVALRQRRREGDEEALVRVDVDGLGVCRRALAAVRVEVLEVRAVFDDVLDRVVCLALVGLEERSGGLDLGQRAEVCGHGLDDFFHVLCEIV